MAATEIKLERFNTLTSKSYDLGSEGITFEVNQTMAGSNNTYFAIMFGEATNCKIAYGSNPAAADFIDVSTQYGLESTANGILNTGPVRITLTGTGSVVIVTK